LRTRVIEEFIGRDEEVRRRRAEINARIRRAREEGDVDNGSLLIGQDAGLIERVEPAAEIVERLVREAEELLAQRAAAVLSDAARA
jgi:NAD(P)H-dependent flavin oxidoreductase YrpB (nitropropane dioxygenase family)